MRFMNSWSINKNKIKKFYINTQRDDDILISASPTFILDEICKILKEKLYLTQQSEKQKSDKAENQSQGFAGIVLLLATDIQK